MIEEGASAVDESRGSKVVASVERRSVGQAAKANVGGRVAGESRV